MSEGKEKNPLAALAATLQKNGGSKGGPKKFGDGVDPGVGKKTQIQKGQKLRLGKKKKVGLMTEALEKVGRQRVPKSLIAKLNNQGAGLRYGITRAELAAMGQYARSSEGVAENFRVIAERTDGPVRQEFSGPEGGAIEITEGDTARDKLFALTARLRDRLAKQRAAAGS